MHILFLSILIILWWIALWGLLDTLLHSFIAGSRTKALFVYSSILTFVVGITWIRPDLLEHFV